MLSNIAALKIVIDSGLLKGCEFSAYVVVLMVLLLIVGLIGILMLRHTENGTFVVRIVVYLVVAFIIAMPLILYNPPSYLVNTENGKSRRYDSLQEALDVKKAFEKSHSQKDEDKKIRELIEDLEMEKV